MMRKIPDVPTMSVPQAGKLLGLGRDASYRAAAANEIPTLVFGRRRRVPTATLRRMLGLDASEKKDAGAA
jgi:excisionase family DNA binding protein